MYKTVAISCKLTLLLFLSGCGEGEVSRETASKELQDQFGPKQRPIDTSAIVANNKVNVSFNNNTPEKTESYSHARRLSEKLLDKKFMGSLIDRIQGLPGLDKNLTEDKTNLKKKVFELQNIYRDKADKIFDHLEVTENELQDIKNDVYGIVKEEIMNEITVMNIDEESKLSLKNMLNSGNLIY